MRFTLSWLRAIRLPTVIVSTARTTIAVSQGSAIARKPSPSKTTSRTRKNAAKEAAFTPAAMKAVTGVGAPS